MGSRPAGRVEGSFPERGRKREGEKRIPIVFFIIITTRSSSLSLQHLDGEARSLFFTLNCSNLEIVSGLEQNHRSIIDPVWLLNQKSLNFSQDVFLCSKENSLIAFVPSLS